MILWGIDLGGTKIEGAIIDPEDPGKAIHRLRLPTESHLGYVHVLGQIAGVVERLEGVSGTKRPGVIGFGTPGATEPSTGVIKNSNSTCLNGRSLRDDISSKLGVRAVLANDANCFALAEATLGVARGCRVVVGLILGTGVGGGIVVDERVWDGVHGIAGEWGHNPICGEMTPCYCGRMGCVETVLGGPSLERFHREQTGEQLGLKEIVSRADLGDPACLATMERLREKFGFAIAAVINILDPEAIVIGGGVGNIPMLYSEETRQAVLRNTFNGEVRTRFLKPELGDSAGVFGAAMLTRQPSAR